ncbi:hypothetical protein CAPTEDRAFT_221878 [Capitella teleta]|uniref:Uncharacterized protein n=1 Tax=Capitella teleta TaxID=283909 RepID=R7US92_CAPTE|nr:hypothetical protein CAPTEDRAFT_221878 [Capitella teleta]|eukprot:ELU09384.1 hypothetical protein CAPTEDRAFT_221878 [Capitella teleta]
MLSPIFVGALCILQIAAATQLFYGNEVERRPHQQISHPRVWMDFNATLGWGHLKKFTIYTIDLEQIPDSTIKAHPDIPQHISENRIYIRLQLWQPYSKEDFQFGRLVWEKRIHIEVTQFGRKLEIPVTEEVEVSETYVLGMTNEGPINPISCTEVHGQKRAVYYRRIYLGNRESFPEVNRDDYVFNKKKDFFPVIFSIGAYIENEPFLEEGNGVFRGNTIRPRKSILGSGAKRAWLDDGIQLYTGYVHEFLFHVQNASRMPLTIRLQIKLSQEEAPKVTSDHKVGWTYESDYGPIAYEFNSNHRTKVFTIENNIFPVVGESHSFDIELPYQFSFGVVLSDEPPDGYNPTNSGGRCAESWLHATALFGLIAALKIIITFR